MPENSHVNKYNSTSGYTTERGHIYDENHQYKGQVDEHGTIYDSNYNVVGYYGDHGYVYDQNHHTVGYEDKNGVFYNQNHQRSNYMDVFEQDGKDRPIGYEANCGAENKSSTPVDYDSRMGFFEELEYDQKEFGRARGLIGFILWKLYPISVIVVPLIIAISDGGANFFTAVGVFLAMLLGLIPWFIIILLLSRPKD